MYCVFAYLCMCAFVCILVYVCICVFVCMCTCICVFVCMSVYLCVLLGVSLVLLMSCIKWKHLFLSACLSIFKHGSGHLTPNDLRRKIQIFNLKLVSVFLDTV